MSSNKYYHEWTYSDYSHKKESYQQSAINKLEKDIKRLDRAIDKIETENEAKKIFGLGKQLYPVQFMPTQIPKHNIYRSPAGTLYIIINGCLIKASK